MIKKPTPPTPIAPAEFRPGDDDVLDRREAARYCHVAIPTFDRQVARGTLPAPFYVASRSPRWWRGELRRELEARQRMLPREAKELRRRAREAQRNAAAAANP